MIMSGSIAVLGCGWLGLDLARSFVADGHIVHGSCQSQASVQKLSSFGVKGHNIQLKEKSISGNISSFLQGSSRLFLTLPPGLRSDPKRNFVAVIKQLLPYIQNSSVQEVVFTSSTGVFGPQQGVVTADTFAIPQTESGRQLLEVEGLLLTQSSFTSKIIRLGGLLGDDRHPVSHLIKKRMVAEPQAPVNLIHKQDAIGLVRFLSEHGRWQSIYHAVCPWHPTKKDFYEKAAQELNLPQPIFDQKKGTTTKKVMSPQVAAMGYVFKQPRLGLTLTP